MLKVLPLLVPLFGVLRGKRYTFQWASMMILFYFAEGVVRAWSESPPSSTLATVEIVLSTLIYFAAIYYAKLSVAEARPGARKDAP